MTASLELTRGSTRAVLHTAGVALQSLVVQGRELVVGYPSGPDRDGFRGALLVPWPNRLRDGHYVFDGVAYQAPINEVARHNALHGLLAWTEFSTVERTQSSARVRAVLPVQPAYPSRLTVEVELELLAEGLQTTVHALNDGDRPAPYGVSTHPYLTCGTGDVDDWSLLLPAREVLEADDRMLPTGQLLDAAEAGLDFHRPAPLRGVQLDHCFRVNPAVADPAAELRAADGSGVRITAQGSWAGWWQAFTSDASPGPLRRAAVALEPMSCPPEAFRTGTDVVVLEPGMQHQASWTIAAV